MASELQGNIIGRMQIGGHGTYHRHRHHESWESYDPYQVKEYDYTDKEGKAHYKTVTKYHWVQHSSTTDPHKTEVIDFSYKMDAYGNTYAVQYEKVKSGGWFSSATQSWQAVLKESGLPLWHITTKGGAAALKTFSNSDPVSAMITSFTLALKLTPKAFNATCESCARSATLPAKARPLS